MKADDILADMQNKMKNAKDDNEKLLHLADLVKIMNENNVSFDSLAQKLGISFSKPEKGLIEKKYNNADYFLEMLDKADNPIKKDKPKALVLGFVDGNIWHLIHLKYLKGRTDIADKFREKFE